MSCGFPTINFCNPGVHYETPCIYELLEVLLSLLLLTRVRHAYNTQGEMVALYIFIFGLSDRKWEQ